MANSLLTRVVRERPVLSDAAQRELLGTATRLRADWDRLLRELAAAAELPDLHAARDDIRRVYDEQAELLTDLAAVLSGRDADLAERLHAEEAAGRRPDRHRRHHPGR